MQQIRFCDVKKSRILWLIANNRNYVIIFIMWYKTGVLQLNGDPYDILLRLNTVKFKRIEQASGAI